jgi:hypothetical protein
MFFEFRKQKKQKKHLLFNVFWHPKAENIEKAFTFLSFLHHKYQNIKKSIVFYLISDDFPIVWLTITPGLPSSACNMIQLPCRRVTTFRLGICIVLISCTCSLAPLVFISYSILIQKSMQIAPLARWLILCSFLIQFLFTIDANSFLCSLAPLVLISYSILIQNWSK